ncbi:ribose 5-phosphate isomerase B [Candidatus Peregrinibacteria bacterium]|nr:ribose 5-phosphate isomerase B [Candidatus Peregrinibacteria bacterium]
MNDPLKIILASDHAGFELKEVIKAYLERKSIEVLDIKTVFEEEDDYPPIIREACAKILEEEAMGIIFGGSGNGEAMAANKVRGIRCAVCYNEEVARLARAHNDANVMSLGGRVTNPELAKKLVDIFLGTAFEGGRHKRRVDDLEVEQ